MVVIIILLWCMLIRSRSTPENESYFSDDMGAVHDDVSVAHGGTSGSWNGYTDPASPGTAWTTPRTSLAPLAAWPLVTPVARLDYGTASTPHTSQVSAAGLMAAAELELRTPDKGYRISTPHRRSKQPSRSRSTSSLGCMCNVPSCTRVHYIPANSPTRRANGAMTPKSPPESNTPVVDLSTTLP
jgi:hypothetical protein